MSTLIYLSPSSILPTQRTALRWYYDFLQPPLKENEALVTYFFMGNLVICWSKAIMNTTDILHGWFSRDNFSPHISVGKESTCNAGDPGSTLGLGRSTGEGIGYPLHYSWASLVAQLVKNLPAMRETWVQSLGWEDPLEKGKGYPLQYSGLENSMDWTVHGVSKSQTWLSDFHFHFSHSYPSIHSFTHQFNKHPTVLELCWVPGIQWWVRQDSSSVSEDRH